MITDTPFIDTSSPDLSTPGVAPTLPEPATFNSEYAVSPQVAELREIALSSYMPQSTSDPIVALFTENQKDLKTYAGYRSIHESHNRMNDGTYIPRFESFIWGTNNEERLARSETTTDKWVKGLSKFQTTVAAGVAGGTVGFVGGIASAIQTGTLEAMYDNDFSRALDDWQNTNAAYNTHYYTQAEKDASLFGQMGTTNFWADKVLGGVGFTVGAIASEAVWALATGGIGLVPAAATRFGIRQATKHLTKEIAQNSTKAAATAGLKTVSKEVAEAGAFTVARGGTQAATRTVGKEVAEAGASAVAKSGAKQSAGSVKGSVAMVSEPGSMAVRKAPTLANDVEVAMKLGKESGKASKAINQALGRHLSTDELRRIANVADTYATAAKIAGTTRFMLTSSGFEAGFEARNYEKLAVDDFFAYHREQGTVPTDEEIQTFQEKLDGTKNAVFGANMALLAVSNMAMFGQYFKAFNGLKQVAGGLAKGTARVSKGVDRTFFRLGTTKGSDGVWKAMDAKWYHKAGKFTAGLSKNVISEGFWEEGGQGIASGGYSSLVASAYDEKNFDKTLTWLESFEKSFADQFTTKDGQTEVLIGSIIGGLFGVVGGGGPLAVANRYKSQSEVADLQNELEGYAKQNTEILYTGQDILAKMGKANRDHYLGQKLTKALDAQDVLATELVKGQQLISKLESSYAVGKEDFFEEVLKSAISKMDTDTLMSNLDITEAEAIAYKESAVENITQTVEKYKNARKLGESLFGVSAIGGVTKDANGKKFNTQNLINATAYGITMANIAENTLVDALTVIEDMTTSHFSTIATEAMTLASVSTQLTSDRDTLINTKESLEAEREELMDKIAMAQEIEKNNHQVRQLSIALNRVNESIEENNSKLQIVDSQILDQGGTIAGSMSTISPTTLREKLDTLKEEVDKMPQSVRLPINQALNVAIDSVEHLKAYNEMTDRLINPEFRYKTYNGIFSAAVGSTMSINDFTKEALLNWYTRHENITDLGNNGQNTETDERAINNIDDIPPADFPTIPTTEIDVTSTEEETTIVEDEVVNYEAKINEIREKINTVQSEKAALQDLEAQLNDFLDELSGDIGESAEAMQNKVNEIKEYIEKLRKNATRKKKNALDEILKIRSEFKQEFKHANDLIDQINAAKERSRQLSEIEEDLSNQIKYYQNLQSRGISTVEDVNSELNRLSNKRSVLRGLVDKLNRLISIGRDALNSLMDIVNVKQRNVNTFLAFRPDPISEAPGASEEGQAQIDFDEGIREDFRVLQEQLDDALEEADQQELKNTNYESERTNLDDKIRKLDTNIRYLEELKEETETVQREIKEDIEVIPPTSRIDDASIARGTVESRKEFDMYNLLPPTDKDGKPVPYRRKKPADVVEIFFNYDEYLDEAFTKDEFLEMERPTNADFSRFDEIHEMPDDEITDEIRKEAEALRRKFFVYNTAAGSTYGETNLLELLQLHQSMKEDAVINNQKTDITEEDESALVETSQKNMPRFSDSVSNVYEDVMVSEQGTRVHHMSLGQLISEVIKKFDNSIVVYIDDMVLERDADLEIYNEKNYTIRFETEEGQEIVVGKREKGSQFKLEKPLSEVTSMLTIRQKNAHGYNQVYSKNVDGTYSPAATEFSQDRPNSGIRANEVKSGETVTLYHNIKDDYNVKLQKELGLNKMKGESFHDHEDRVLHDEEYQKRAHIEVRRKNARIGGINAIRGPIGEKIFHDVRVAAIRDGEVTVTVTNVYRNYPKFTLNEEGVPIFTEVDKTSPKYKGVFAAINNNGKLEFTDGIADVDHRFTEAVASDYEALPYVLIEIGDNNFASFPVKIEPKIISKKDAYEKILNNENLSEEVKLAVINEMIKTYNLNHQLVYSLDDVQLMEDQLTMVEVYPDLRNAKELKQATVTSAVNVNDAFSSPKFKLDLKGAKMKNSGDAVTDYGADTDTEIEYGDETPNSDIECKN